MYAHNTYTHTTAACGTQPPLRTPFSCRAQIPSAARSFAHGTAGRAVPWWTSWNVCIEDSATWRQVISWWFHGGFMVV